MCVCVCVRVCVCPRPHPHPALTWSFFLSPPCIIILPHLLVFFFFFFFFFLFNLNASSNNLHTSLDKTDEKVPVYTVSSSTASSSTSFANGVCSCPDGVCVSPGPAYNGPPIDRDALPSPLRGCVDWPMNSDWLEFAFAPVVCRNPVSGDIEPLDLNIAPY